MSHIETKELYKIAIDTRKLEINLFWQRSNYFLVLNTAIAVGTFSRIDKADRIPFIILGIVISYLWVCMNLGSRYWQVRWEHEVAELEMKITNEILFSADKSRTNEVVKHYISNGGKSRLGVYDYLALEKPSVNKMMSYLSASFVLFWIGILLCMILNYSACK